MKKNNTYYFFCTILLFVAVFLVFSSVSYVPNEGFNPSDEGVVLAQSYRLLRGEVPHKDFISIRPVGSGILHQIHFLYPNKLLSGARWFVIIQYFLYSLFWILILFKAFPILKRKKYFFPGFLLFCFVLNINHYNIYPWTTIDAVFWSTGGFLLLFSSSQKGWNGVLQNGLSLLFFAFAALSRQTFMFLFLFAFVYLVVGYIREKKWVGGILTMILPAIPFVLYLFVLLKNNVFADFVGQLTGRSELFQTGFLAFAKSFLKSDFLPLYALIILILSYHWLFENRIKKIKGNRMIEKTEPFLYYLSFFSIIGLSLLVFVFPDQLFTYAFDLFWLCLLGFLMGVTNNFFSRQQILVILSGLLLAWTSSISLGDNAPVFTTGILAVTGLTVFSCLLKPVFKKPNLLHLLPALFSVWLVGIFVLSVSVQAKNNYRDLPAKELQNNLSELFDRSGNVKINQNVYQYYQSFLELYQKLGEPNGAFVLLPNNAALYPVLDSPNPLPLDWMQPAEYVGSEENVHATLRDLIDEHKVYFILDVYNTKLIAEGFKKLDWKYYDYYEMIVRNCKEIPCENPFFKVYK